MRIKIIAISVLLASCSSMSLPKPSWPDMSWPDLSWPDLSWSDISLPKKLPSLVPHKIDIQQGNLVTPEMREKIKIGMSPAVVRSILGTPLITDPFHAKRWDYVYTLQQGGKLVERQRLTLYFEDEHLARIDDTNMPPLPASVPATGTN
jgi:outer membrane protein assembly factor BamE